MNRSKLITIIVLVSLAFSIISCTPGYTLKDEFYSKVAGVTFENEDGVNRQDLLPKLKEGTKIELRLEPTNPYDKNAVEIYSPQGKIGYIKKELAPYISWLLLANVRVDVFVSEITGGESGLYYGCNIKIQVFEKKSER